MWPLLQYKSQSHHQGIHNPEKGNIISWAMHQVAFRPKNTSGDPYARDLTNVFTVVRLCQVFPFRLHEKIHTLIHRRYVDVMSVSWQQSYREPIDNSLNLRFHKEVILKEKLTSDNECVKPSLRAHISPIIRWFILGRSLQVYVMWQGF